MFMLIMNLSFIMQVHYKNNHRPEDMLDIETDMGNKEIIILWSFIS